MNLHTITKSLQTYYKGAEGTEKIILNCALAASGAVVVGGWFPGLALASTIVSCVGAVWTMYILICKQLELPLRENILRVLASAALSNIATNLITVFALELLGMFAPGISAASGALVTFASVYLAGKMFLEMLHAFAKKGVVGAALGALSQDDLKSEIKKQTPTGEDVKAARSAFEDSKK